MEVNMTEIPMEEIELKFSKFFDIEFGGHWRPKDCRPRWKVCAFCKFKKNVNASSIHINNSSR